MNSEPKDFWDNISKLNKKPSNMCSVIDNKIGDEACDAFCVKYKNLYNKNPSTNITEIHNDINNLILCKCCGEDHDPCKHMHSVTFPMVKSMVKKLKPNQCDEFCGIMSDCLIHGDDRLFVLLAFLYTIMIKHGF